MDTSIPKLKKTVAKTIVILCLTILISWIIVAITAYHTYGVDIWCGKYAPFNVFSIVALCCSVVGAITIASVPGFRHRFRYLLKSVPDKIESIVDSGTTPYFKPAYYRLKHGMYKLDSNPNIAPDVYGLPIVDQNIPLNSFNMDIYKKYRGNYARDLNKIQDIVVDRYTYTNESNLDAKVKLYLKSLSEIIRIHVIGSTCMVVESWNKGPLLIHKRDYLPFLKDAMQKDVWAVMIDEQVNELGYRCGPIEHLHWLVDILTNPVITSIQSTTALRSIYGRVLQELDILYSICVEPLAADAARENMEYISDGFIEFIQNDPKYGYLALDLMLFEMASISFLGQKQLPYLIQKIYNLLNNDEMDMLSFYNMLIDKNTVASFDLVIPMRSELFTKYNQLTDIIKTLSTTSLERALRNRYNKKYVHTTKIKYLLTFVPELEDDIKEYNKGISKKKSKAAAMMEYLPRRESTLKSLSGMQQFDTTRIRVGVIEYAKQMERATSSTMTILKDKYELDKQKVKQLGKQLRVLTSTSPNSDKVGRLRSEIDKIESNMQDYQQLVRNKTSSLAQQVLHLMTGKPADSKSIKDGEKADVAAAQLNEDIENTNSSLQSNRSAAGPTSVALSELSRLQEISNSTKAGPSIDMISDMPTNGPDVIALSIPDQPVSEVAPTRSMNITVPPANPSIGSIFAFDTQASKEPDSIFTFDTQASKEPDSIFTFGTQASKEPDSIFTFDTQASKEPDSIFTFDTQADSNADMDTTTISETNADVIGVMDDMLKTISVEGVNLGNTDLNTTPLPIKESDIEQTMHIAAEHEIPIDDLKQKQTKLAELIYRARQSKLLYEQIKSARVANAANVSIDQELSKHDEMVANLTTAQAAANELVQAVEDLDKQVEQKQTEQIRAVAELSSSDYVKEGMVRTLLTENARIVQDARVATAEAELSDLEAKIAKSRDLLDVLTQREKALTDEYETKINAAGDEVKSANDKLEDAKAKLYSVRAELQEAESIKQTTEADIADIEKQKAALQNEIVEIGLVLESTRANAELITRDHESINEAFNAKSAELHYINQAILQAKSVADAYGVANPAELNAKLTELSAQKLKIEQELQDCANFKYSVRKQIFSILKMEEDDSVSIDELLLMIINKSNRNKRSVDDCTEREKQLRDAHEKDIQKFKDSKNKLLSRINDVETARNLLQQRLSESLDVNQKQSDRIDSYRIALENVRREKMDLEANLESYNESRSEAATKLSDAKDEIDRLKKDLADQAAALGKQSATLEEQNKELKKGMTRQHNCFKLGIQLETQDLSILLPIETNIEIYKFTTPLLNAMTLLLEQYIDPIKEQLGLNLMPPPIPLQYLARLDPEPIEDSRPNTPNNFETTGGKADILVEQNKILNPIMVQLVGMNSNNNLRVRYPILNQNNVKVMSFIYSCYEYVKRNDLINGIIKKYNKCLQSAGGESHSIRSPRFNKIKKWYALCMEFFDNDKILSAWAGKDLKGWSFVEEPDSSEKDTRRAMQTRSILLEYGKLIDPNTIERAYIKV
jgi:hypothetical protein